MALTSWPMHKGHQMRYRVTGHIAILAAIFVLASLVMGLAINGAACHHLMRSQLHNCAIVGFIAFVGLSLASGVHQEIAGPIETTERMDDPAYAAARQSLYQALQEMDLPAP